MKNPVLSAKNFIKSGILSAYRSAVENGALPASDPAEFEVSLIKDNTFGEYDCNFAMKMTRSLKMAPRKIAEAVIPFFPKNEMFSSIEIAGPGFINFRASQEYFSGILNVVLDEKDDFGKSDVGRGEKVMIEFVSANPTGVMHVGNARGGVLGDSLAALLEWSGHKAWREFYINDTGNQVENYFQSFRARYLQMIYGKDNVPFPENGYHGEDVVRAAKAFYEEFGDKYKDASEDDCRKVMGNYGISRNIERMKKDLSGYGINYDCWFSEKSLHDSGYVKETIDILRDNGYLYEKDGATWFRATDLGCEKDEVMIKSNGFYTYYAVDIAYHRNKFIKREFDRVVDVLGADHHGHTLRFRAGMKALGIDPDRLQFALYQLVNLMDDGVPVKMSKRTGKAITLSDLLLEVPLDACRFFFISRQPGSVIDFDLKLAKEKTSDNPVFYVQYAHARICSILKNLEAENITVNPKNADLSLLTQPEELDLIRHLATLPDTVAEAARDFNPARICKYLTDLATMFHRFYTNCHVKGCENSLLQARAALLVATRGVLKNALSIIGVSAPEAM